MQEDVGLIANIQIIADESGRQTTPTSELSQGFVSALKQLATRRSVETNFLFQFCFSCAHSLIGYWKQLKSKDCM